MNLRSFLAAVALTTLMLALTLAPPSGSQLQRQYDPWADINSDGLIDIRDIAYECRLFGTTGDPTKYVVITLNWTEGCLDFKLLAYNCTNLVIPTAGFKTLTVYIRASSVDAHPFQIYQYFLIERRIVDTEISSATSDLKCPFAGPPPPPEPPYFPANFKRTYDVTFSEFVIVIWNNSTKALQGTIYYYLSS